MMLRNLDVALIVIAAPIALLAGVPAPGYGIGAATWILLRGFAGAASLQALTARDLGQFVALRLGYRSLRVILLVAAVVVTEKALGRHNGIAALAVIVSAFTVHLAWSIAASGRQGRRPGDVQARAERAAQR